MLRLNCFISVSRENRDFSRLQSVLPPPHSNKMAALHTTSLKVPHALK